MSNGIRYAIYARKSTEGEDRQIQSIDDQLTVLSELAKRNDLKVVRVFQESKSAKTPFKRPVFDELVKAIKSGEINGIISWQINRLHRNPAEGGLIQQLLQDGELQEIRTSDRIYRPDDNALLLSVEGGMSNQFILDLKKNVKRGIRAKTRNGGISGPPPMGYLNKRDDKTIIKDPDRFDIVRKMFDMYLSGVHSTGDLKKMFDENGVRTPKRKQTGGKPVTRSLIYCMLNNVRYTGYVSDPDDPTILYPAHYPAMISSEEYEKIQLMLGNHGNKKHASRLHFELRGLLKCGECGCSITAERHLKKLRTTGETVIYTYYHCTKKKGSCGQGGVKEEELFKQLDDLLSQYEITDELYQWGIEAIKAIGKEELEFRDKRQEIQFGTIKDIQAKLDRLLDNLEDGYIDGSVYAERSKPLKVELAAAHKRQEEAAERARNWYEIVGATLERLNNASENFRKGDLKMRRDILLAIGYNPLLIDRKVEITPNNWLIPIKEQLPDIKVSLEKVRNDPQQIEKGAREAIMSTWYPELGLNQRP